MKKLMSRLRLLLHCCCAPCSTHPIEFLKERYDLTLFFYNPSIYPHDEYIRRRDESIKLAEKLDIPIRVLEDDEKVFLDFVKGHEDEAEGEERCMRCYRQRLEKTGDVAEAELFDYFGTTLTISPHKVSQRILEIGRALALQLSVKFLSKDFKLNDGFKHSCELSKEHNLYRQNYCGCRFSIRK